MSTNSTTAATTLPEALEIISKTRVVEEGYSASELFLPTQLENGCYHRISHVSSSTKTKMIFGLFLPSNYKNEATSNTPVLFWLSGLTCDDTNFAMKAGSRAFSAAEKQGIAIVMPDTSPRHDESIPNVDSYDLGIGAGFYINATQEPYNQHYQMYTYVTNELVQILNQLHIGKHNVKSISGHSMGGHGALTIALKGIDRWASVSAFAPICNPTNCPWGQKAFEAYLGNVEDGKNHDSTCLIQSMMSANVGIPYDTILIDQGTADNFLEEQLKPEALMDVVKKAEGCHRKITLNYRKGFDHSYYFIAAFIESHVEFHGEQLKKKL